MQSLSFNLSTSRHCGSHCKHTRIFLFFFLLIHFKNILVWKFPSVFETLLRPLPANEVFSQLLCFFFHFVSKILLQVCRCPVGRQHVQFHSLRNIRMWMPSKKLSIWNIKMNTLQWRKTSRKFEKRGKKSGGLREIYYSIWLRLLHRRSHWWYLFVSEWPVRRNRAELSEIWSCWIDNAAMHNFHCVFLKSTTKIRSPTTTENLEMRESFLPAIID